MAPAGELSQTAADLQRDARERPFATRIRCFPTKHASRVHRRSGGVRRPRRFDRQNVNVADAHEVHHTNHSITVTVVSRLCDAPTEGLACGELRAHGVTV